MNKVKRSLDNQAIGLVPLLLFMFLDNYFSYLLSFIIGVTFCFVCIFLFQILSKDKVYQFLLLPAATTLVLYSIFLCLRLEPVLFIYSPLITEVLLVVVLAFLGFAKRTILRRIRTSQHPTYKRTLMRTTLNEFFFCRPAHPEPLYIASVHYFGIQYSARNDAERAYGAFFIQRAWDRYRSIFDSI